MDSLKKLFENNRRWAEKTQTEDKQFFDRLLHQQNPEFLWIGCSDSRVPANQITGLAPGEVFVHRNVANVVIPTDLNCLSVMQYAIDVLGVKHIMVVGHYGCGGVRAALMRSQLGLIDNWLRHIENVREKHHDIFQKLENENDKWDKLCELNVVEQALHVCQTTVVRDAWQRGHDVTVHGWIYRLQDGLLRDLNLTVSSQNEIQSTYRNALKDILE
jgi:carbonic anhydrase